MPQDSNFEQPKISPEQKSSIEIDAEKSLSGAKLEQNLEKENYFTPEQPNISEANSLTGSSQTYSGSNYQPGTAQAIHHDVENILAEGMDSVFLSLDAGTQKIFKTKGEEVSSQITRLLLQTKVKIKEITNLILEWLRIIPQINKHYLEQEAKIKTEKILKIKEKNNQ